ncbi:MAG TPA: hypothetical protein VK912_02300 [Longimicrobiales bacterium]|nr:hypothetical protein [Longimicrobiales bacterium]
MSLTAGFDLVIELSNEAVLNLVKRNMQIPGAVANPPFEIAVPFAQPAQGQAWLIVDDITLELKDNDELVFTLPFSCGAVELQTPIPLDVTGLHGTITLTMSAQGVLISKGGSSFTFGVNWDDAVSNIAINQLAAALAGTPIDAATFQSLAQQALADFVNGLPAITTSIEFQIVPAQDGAFGNNLQFAAAEVHCIGNADPAKQALGLFGTLVAANQGNGDHTLKTETAIQPGRELAISMSPGAFRRIIFCPALAASLGTKLPSTCGNTPVHRNGLDITKIEESFHHNGIKISMTAKRSGVCYEARGDVSGTLTFSIANNALVPDLDVGKPDVTVDIPWYCKIAAAVVGGVWGLVIAQVLDEVLDVILDFFAPDVPGVSVPTVALAGFPGAVFTDVQVSPEGLTLQADLPIILSKNKSTLKLSGAVTVINIETLSTGTYKVEEGCLAGEYPWTEQLLHLSAGYVATPTLLCRPIEYTWSIENIQLPSGHGQVTVPVEATHPFPLTVGTTVTADVDVEYTISAASIVLKNAPSQGSYAVKLGMRAKDAKGTVLQTSQHVFFAGHAVQIEGFAGKLAYCSAEQFRKKVVPTKWPDFEEPSPKDLIVITLLHSSLEHPDSDQLVAATELTYGQRYQKAINLHRAGLLGSRSRLGATAQGA